MVSPFFQLKKSDDIFIVVKNGDLFSRRHRSRPLPSHVIVGPVFLQISPQNIFRLPLGVTLLYGVTRGGTPTFLCGATAFYTCIGPFNII